MSLSDSMFLFEITIKDLKSHLRCNEFAVTAEFANVFKVCFEQAILNSASKKARQMRFRDKHKVRVNNGSNKNRGCGTMSLNSRSILVTKCPSWLISNMNEFPLRIFAFHKRKCSYEIGSSHIQWSKIFKNYISHVHKNKIQSPVCTQTVHNIYNEKSMKRVATVEICIKLLYLGDKVSNPIRSVSSATSIKIYHSLGLKQRCISSTTKHSECNRLHASENVFKCNSERILNINSAHNILTETSNTKSESQIISSNYENITKSLSVSSILVGKRNPCLRYIFGDREGSYGNKIYCIGYFTVEKDKIKSPKVPEAESSHNSSEPKRKFKFKKCDRDCGLRGQTSESSYSLNLLGEAAQIGVIKCNDIDCNERTHRKLPLPPDDRILLDISNITKDCCVDEKITEDIIGSVTAKMKVHEDPCFCTCECTFGFMKRTTYCTICGGYEVAGEELTRKRPIEMPIPCPFFHKLVDKSKLKTWSTSGSESKKKGDDSKFMKIGSSQKAALDKHLVSEKKSVESEKDSKQGKKKKTDDRFKFNYGYKGIPPQIGHSRCVLPCTGTLDNVPKNMGWLWTAENIPGMKFRPLWKPGATSKHIVRLLKLAKNPGEVMSKKKRKDTGKKKRPLKRPLLVVHKKDGEYTVTMETMKTYTKPRALNQHPYEDKPVVTYTIGRTEEENRERHKKKERERRRLERAQRLFIQSTFRDICNEICMKTYQQALGILPETEVPNCLCYPALPSTKPTNMNVSCSCSEEITSLGSDTDSDEWIVEFTPPNASFDPTYKGKKIFKIDNGTQYTYLDYKVKLLDRFGNPVPRFFKGPDGKQQCSDLGGFWSPDKKWLEINIDGYIAPDGRWAPNNFVGPNGENVDAEDGKFQASNGKWLIVGVDGYIDSQNRWRYYSKESSTIRRKQRFGKNVKNEKTTDKNYAKSDTSWSCFGDAPPKHLSKLGIIGHGGDRKLLMSTLESMLARGEDVIIPQPKTIFHLPSSKKSKQDHKKPNLMISRGFDVNTNSQCHHSLPSDKGIVAVDGRGHKTYFRLKSSNNKRSSQRLTTLAKQGISLSSFHVPCFKSFINAEIMKQQNRERLLALAGRNVSTQAS